MDLRRVLSPDRPSPGRLGLPWATLALLLVVARGSHAEAPAAAGLLLGEYRLAAVTDGDTIKVAGLDASVRLLGIDTEETFKSRADRRLFASGWPAYLEAKQLGATRPVKMATPLGEEARRWAQEFFAGSPTVRLERDHPHEERDAHGRYLAYAFAWRDGAWVNYSVECVRAGMSPYFTKYGYSRRFHAQLARAEAEARTAGRGVWAADALHYPDYPARKAWWDARAEFLRRTLDPAASAGPASATPVPPAIDLRRDDALATLAGLEGRVATVVGLVARIVPPRAPAGGPAASPPAATAGTHHGPWRIALGAPHGPSFPLIVFDGALLAAIDAERLVGEFVAARGVISRYRHADGGEEWQMVIRAADQVQPSLPATRAGPPRSPRAPAASAPPPAFTDDGDDSPE